MITKKIKKWFKRFIMLACILFIIVIIAIIFANWKIPHDTKAYIYNNVNAIPPQKVALVLGASPKLGNGVPNPYFTYRIKAAKQLYEAGKVEAFILSGDNNHKNYNEPQAMKDSLVQAGVPDSIIYLDYAGFRTLDSVVRTNKIFGQKSFIIVSQQFHNERAIFIAQYYGLEAYGYNARDLALNRVSSKTKIREILARVKVFIDMALNKQPKFLGESIEIK